MVKQLDLLPVIRLDRDPSVERVRDRILRELEARNGRRFIEQACEFVLSYLSLHGPSSGETVTDACKEAGISPPTGDRSFGVVYAKLSRRGQIVKHGTCPRRKGHATAGGIIWRLA